VNVERATLAALCRKYSICVQVPGLDGTRLLWAIAFDESSDGANCAPRHEPAYCRGGRYFDRQKTAQWNCLAHMSYGPWQVMYPNCCGGAAPDVSPLELLTNLELCAQKSAEFIGRISKIAAVRAGAGASLSDFLHQFALSYNGPATTDAYVMALAAAWNTLPPEPSPAHKNAKAE
jgi:hypothetical protein